MDKFITDSQWLCEIPDCKDTYEEQWLLLCWDLIWKTVESDDNSAVMKTNRLGDLGGEWQDISWGTFFSVLCEKPFMILPVPYRSNGVLLFHNKLYQFNL